MLIFNLNDHHPRPPARSKPLEHLALAPLHVDHKQIKIKGESRLLQQIIESVLCHGDRFAAMIPLCPRDLLVDLYLPR